MNKSDVNNIVNIKNSNGKSINLGQILPDVHKIFLRGLKPIIQQYYDQLDDALFDLAEKAENNEKQTHYFDAMREVRKKKELMVRKFSENIQSVFKKFKKGQFDYFQQDNKQSQSLEDSLSLVGEEELDEKLAISNIVGKANTSLHQHLFALEKRFTLLAGGTEIKIDDIPVSPNVTVHSFSQSLEHLTIDVTVKLIMLKMYERALIVNLNQIYQDINDHLIKQGIYPDIKFKVGNGRRNSGQPLSQNQTTEHASNQTNIQDNPYQHDLTEPNNPTQGYQQVYVPDSQYENIISVLSNRHPVQPSSMPVFDPSVVHNALNLLQLDELKSLSLQQAGLSPTEIKDQLINKLKSMDTDGENKVVKQKDEDTIDLISMLFQFLVDDRNLPDKIQVLLAKLQIPYLHLALKDRNLFSNKENNARKLLDTVATASIGWSEENDKRGHFINKIESIIQHILENHQGEINFESLIDDFEAFHQKSEKRSHVLEKRTSEKALGQERIFRAKENTAEILKAKMKNFTLPKMITDLLLNSWANVLVLTHLRHQDEPEILEKNIKFIDMLIYVSIKNKSKPATNAQISHVCEKLGYGLKMVAFDEASIKKIRIELFELLLQINGLNPEKKDIELISAKEAILKEPEDGEEEAEIVHFIKNRTINPQDKEVKHIKDQHYEAASSIQTGEWIEFLAEEDENKNLRAKLSWISPISNKLLFVNSRGVKVTDKSVDELANDFRIEIARILQQVPIFERAMSAIAKKIEADKDDIENQSTPSSKNETENNVDKDDPEQT
ncbi:DUF1631 domain-containing protein [Marinicella rhabdoformis]|uniref:DUF1631 domain-containing protein n=1 Tax=Marinicella rhabdoformis TaxID=2580566 RepID=UPI0012AEB9AB|nr:DUF1631 domain-containing protein [Marinicella rhabdoformis]